MTQSKFRRQRQKGENTKRNFHYLSQDIVKAFFCQKNNATIFGIIYAAHASNLVYVNSQIEMQELDIAIKSLKINKSSGEDNIVNELVKSYIFKSSVIYVNIASLDFGY